MFDFRYHALSLAAVLLALAVGVLLGVAIGDAGLVSGAAEDLRADLRASVRAARAEAADARERLDRRDRFEQQTYAALIGDRLADRRIAVVFVTERDGGVREGVLDAITPAGAQLASVSTLRDPVDLRGLAAAAAAANARYAGLASDPDLLADYARRVGEQMVTGGELLDLTRRALYSSTSGTLDGAEGIVVARLDPGERDVDAAKRADVLARGLIAGMRAAGAPVTGVELTTTVPSQIRWYQGSDIPTVDNLDEPAGMASLVFTLDGSASGDYGLRSTADSLVPDALVHSPAG